MVKTILPGQTIGIMGGGKNAHLLTLKAREMGYRVGLLTEDPDDPANQCADWWLEGSATNTEALLELAEKTDVLLFATEEMDTGIFASLQRYLELPQSTDPLTITQDRLIEKVFLESLNINVSPYATITTVDDIKEAVQSIGYPCVLKPIRVEPNQPKNVFLYSEEDLDKTVKLLATGACILESWIPFEKEMAITLAIDIEQRMSPFPIAETFYQDGKVQRTIVPARIDAEMQNTIIGMGNQIAEALQMVGLLTIELFATAAGAIYVKRLSVQPRRAADFSLDACNVSQYEALLRVVCGLPIPEIILIQPTITYLVEGDLLEEAVSELPNQKEWQIRIHDWNKKQGQITVLTQEVSPFFER